MLPIHIEVQATLEFCTHPPRSRMPQLRRAVPLKTVHPRGEAQEVKGAQRRNLRLFVRKALKKLGKFLDLVPHKGGPGVQTSQNVSFSAKIDKETPKCTEDEDGGHRFRTKS